MSETLANIHHIRKLPKKEETAFRNKETSVALQSVDQQTKGSIPCVVDLESCLKYGQVTVDHRSIDMAVKCIIIVSKKEREAAAICAATTENKQHIRYLKELCKLMHIAKNMW
jgi:hypothetical protein